VENADLTGWLSAQSESNWDTYEKWKVALSGQRYGDWNPNLTSIAALNWFREGFGLDAIGSGNFLALSAGGSFLVIGA
jgi:hypothetical protein